MTFENMKTKTRNKKKKEKTSSSKLTGDTDQFRRSRVYSVTFCHSTLEHPRSHFYNPEQNSKKLLAMSKKTKTQTITSFVSCFPPRQCPPSSQKGNNRKQQAVRMKKKSPNNQIHHNHSLNIFLFSFSTQGK